MVRKRLRIDSLWIALAVVLLIMGAVLFLFTRGTVYMATIRHFKIDLADALSEVQTSGGGLVAKNGGEPYPLTADAADKLCMYLIEANFLDARQPKRYGVHYTVALDGGAKLELYCCSSYTVYTEFVTAAGKTYRYELNREDTKTAGGQHPELDLARMLKNANAAP